MKRLWLSGTDIALSLLSLPLGRRQPMTKPGAAVTAGLCLIVAYAAASVGYAQVVPGQALDASRAPQYRVDPFWPKPLPNRWSMQQIVGISIDSMDHVWF